MPSRILLYILIAAAWIAFAVIVARVQAKAQEDLEEPRVSQSADPPEPGQHLEAAA